ncbi:MAG: nucleotidyltransferase domain-containing protein [Candidatus Altiarchaeota archaeon]|nr:nucleotidyltransferase domain-containing protein [Candidatus Altiarchaeota archaeon]
MSKDTKSRVRKRVAAYPGSGLKQAGSGLIRETPEIVEELKENPDVSTVILFGSQATGKVRPDSDTDLAVLLKKTGPDTEAEVGSMYSPENGPCVVPPAAALDTIQRVQGR